MESYYNFMTMPREIQIYVLLIDNELLINSGDLILKLPYISKYFNKLSSDALLWKTIIKKLRIDPKKIDVKDPKTTALIAIKQANAVAIKHFFPSKFPKSTHLLQQRVNILNELKSPYFKTSLDLRKKMKKVIESESIEALKFLLETKIEIISSVHISFAIKHKKIVALKTIMEKEKDKFASEYEKCQKEIQELEQIKANQAKIPETETASNNKSKFKYQLMDNDEARLVANKEIIYTIDHAYELLKNSSD